MCATIDFHPQHYAMIGDGDEGWLAGHQSGSITGQKLLIN
jgi:hypothetical protein